jgi:SRSO17 transposase
MSTSTLKKTTKSVKKNFIFYILGLILNLEKKNCTKMAKVLNKSHDALYRFLAKHNFFIPLFSQFFIKMANYFAQQKSGYLVVDDSAVSKMFAKCIERLAWIYNSSLGRPERGLCIVVIAWSNGDITIPLTFTWWFSKKVVDRDHYKTKIQYACYLIDQIRNLVKFNYLLADGLYFSKDMAAFLNDRSIKFLMRCASNRKITTDNGVSEQIKNHSSIKLKRNQHSKKISARYGNQSLYFIVQKRLNKNNEYENVYLVSNFELHHSDYIKAYSGRWNIEPIFRTTKSYIGLSHCSCLSLEKQTNHIFAVFFTYNFLQFEKERLKIENPEQALNTLRELKSIKLINRLNAFNQLFGFFA